MTYRLTLFSKERCEQYVTPRAGEVKVGNILPLLYRGEAVGFSAALRAAKKDGSRYAILGIPEDIGPRANCGRGGAQEGWEAFLGAFLNTQANTLFPVSDAVLIGEVELQDLQERSQGADVNTLRDLCGEIDGRVLPIIQEIVSAGLTPIVIGGGHNNAYPIMKGVVAGRHIESLGCCNCDAHADFRRVEGRHSGNSFRVSYEEGILAAYAAIGIHESYAPQEVLNALEGAAFPYYTFESTHIRRECLFEEVLCNIEEYLLSANRPIGIECDLDVIAGIPASAQTPSGMSLEEVAHYVHRMASRLPVAYLHLTEGAPCWDPHAGERYVGRALSLLVTTFLKAMSQHH